MAVIGSLKRIDLVILKKTQNMYSNKLANSGKYMLLALLLLIGLSCRYYKPVLAKTGNTRETENVITSNSPEKYFILRQGANSYALKNIQVDKVKLTLNGTLSVVDSNHFLYLKSSSKKYKYKNEARENILNEVHIYVKNTTLIDATKTLELPLDQVEKIEVIEHDKGRTTTSYILGGIGIGLGAVIVAGVIVALTKSSCPFVSVYDGEKYQVQAELFGGAVNRQLERSDYVPLKAESLHGEYQLRISNELKERQFTNFADLLVIEHPDNVQPFIDVDGKIYQVSNSVSPEAATLNNRQDVLNSVKAKDDVYCSFNDTTISSGINEMILSFNRDGNAKQAKLLLHLKNSYWFDYLYGEFTRKFGNKYAGWQQKQQQKPASEMIRWTEEQQVPLSISIKTITGWKEIRKVKTVGPLANRSIVIPVSLDQLDGGTVKMKLSTGFMFWEIDYAAIDYSSDQPITVTCVKPAIAVDEKGVSVMKELAADDNLYLSQPEVGNYALLTYHFNQQPKTGYSYSVVMHTKGYYQPIREYTGKPDLTFLKKFKEPGEMARFSMNRYQMIPREETIIALNKH